MYITDMLRCVSAFAYLTNIHVYYDEIMYETLYSYLQCNIV